MVPVPGPALRLSLIHIYRLNTITINVPPLRERPDDILPLIHAFMESEGGSNIPIADDLMNFLLQYKWEGNIRELKNCIEYMSSICSHRMELPDLPEYLYDCLLYTSRNERLLPKAVSLKLLPFLFPPGFLSSIPFK